MTPNPTLDRLLELWHKYRTAISSGEVDFSDEEDREFESIKSQLESKLAESEKLLGDRVHPNQLLPLDAYEIRHLIWLLAKSKDKDSGDWFMQVFHKLITLYEKQTESKGQYANNGDLIPDTEKELYEYLQKQEVNHLSVLKQIQSQHTNLVKAIQIQIKQRKEFCGRHGSAYELMKCRDCLVRTVLQNLLESTKEKQD